MKIRVHRWMYGLVDQFSHFSLYCTDLLTLQPFLTPTDIINLTFLMAYFRCDKLDGGYQWWSVYTRMTTDIKAAFLLNILKENRQGCSGGL